MGGQVVAVLVPSEEVEALSKSRTVVHKLTWVEEEAAEFSKPSASAGDGAGALQPTP